MGSSALCGQFWGKAKRRSERGIQKHFESLEQWCRDRNPARTGGNDMSKILFSTGLIAAVAVTATISTASAQTELSLGHFMPPRHTMHGGVFEPWAAQIAEATDGEITVRIYPAGELGAGPAQQYSRAVDGIADITFGLQGYTSSAFPRTLMAELPGLFDDAFDATDAVWNNFELLAPDYQRVHVYGVWFNSPAVIATTDAQITSLEELEGLTIRAPSALGAEVLEAWGASAVTMPVSELYNALQTGVIDGVMIGPDGIRSFRLNEVVSHITTGLPAAMTSFFLVGNQDTWESLTPEQQAAVDEISGRELSLAGTTAYDGARVAAYELFAEDGSTDVYELSAEESARWFEVLGPVYEQAVAEREAEGVAAQAILDAYQGGS